MDSRICLINHRGVANNTLVESFIVVIGAVAIPAISVIVYHCIIWHMLSSRTNTGTRSTLHDC